MQDTTSNFWDSSFSIIESHEETHSTIDRYIPKNVEKTLFQIPSNSGDSVVCPLQEQDLNHSIELNSSLRKKEALGDYQDFLASSLFKKSSKKMKSLKSNDKNRGSKLLRYSSLKLRSRNDMKSFENCSEFVDFSKLGENTPQRKRIRKIPSEPYKVLDAPGMEDNFYSQAIQWTELNQVLISLKNSVYSWCPDTLAVRKLSSYNDYVSGIAVIGDGRKVATSEGDGNLRLLDIESLKDRKLSGHEQRCCTLDFNNHCLVSGSRDRGILVQDIRSDAKPAYTLEGHSLEVCGVKYSKDGNYIASGGSDNQMVVWDLRKRTKLFSSKKHKASVRAIEWDSQNPNKLYTGGGLEDKTLKVWDIQTCELIESINTNSQVTCLKSSQSTSELVSAHGYDDNNLMVWDTSSKKMRKIAVLGGHTQRVLHLGLSPNGQNVISGAGDQTLRFWKVFPSKEENKRIERDQIREGLGSSFGKRISFLR